MQRKTWALIAYGAVAMLMTGMIGPLMPLYLKSIHFPVTEIGVIISVGGFTSAILALFFGNLTERFNRTRLFLGSAVVLAVLPLGFVFARGAGQFIGLELSSGVVGSLVAVTSQAMLMDMAKETGTPGQIMGRARSWRSAMYVVGPLVGGAVATWLSLRGVFLAESGLLLSMVIIAMLLLARQPSPKPKRIPLLALPSLLWNPAVLALLAILLLDFLNFQVIIFIFPLYASASSLPTYLIGALITAQALAYALVQKPVGKLGDRGVSVPALGICAVIGGPLIFALSLSRSPAVLTVLMLLIGLASAPVFLLVTLLVSKAAGEQTGIAMGMINFIVYLAVGLAPLLTSLLASISLRDGFLVPVGSSALALVLVIIALRAKGTMSEEAAEPAAPDRGLVS